jgi:glycerate dehydrogenase
MSKIVVTFDADEQERSLLHDMLTEQIITYLMDLSDKDRSIALERAEIILAWNIPKEIRPEEYQKMKNLRFIQLISAGADHLPFDLIPKDVKIASNTGAYAVPIAEHVMALTLALAKNLFIQHKKLSNGEFDQFSPNVSLKDSVCGILGLGGNGKAIARLMRSFGTKIYAINTSGKTDLNVDFIGTLEDLDYVLSNSDIIVIALPLNKDTRGLIGREKLEIMKKDAILVNIARGEIVDEYALYKHLKNNPRFKVGTDVWWVEPFRDGKFQTRYPFFDLPNFLGSPHNSAIVPNVILDATHNAAENILRFLKGETLKGIVRREEYI